jgi:hypothetical protein
LNRTAPAAWRLKVTLETLGVVSHNPKASPQVRRLGLNRIRDGSPVRASPASTRQCRLLPNGKYGALTDKDLTEHSLRLHQSVAHKLGIAILSGEILPGASWVNNLRPTPS